MSDTNTDAADQIDFVSVTGALARAAIAANVAAWDAWLDALERALTPTKSVDVARREKRGRPS